jgi:hypothetical protein
VEEKPVEPTEPVKAWKFGDEDHNYVVYV